MRTCAAHDIPGVGCRPKRPRIPRFFVPRAASVRPANHPPRAPRLRPHRRLPTPRVCALTHGSAALHTRPHAQQRPTSRTRDRANGSMALRLRPHHAWLWPRVCDLTMRDCGLSQVSACTAPNTVAWGRWYRVRRMAASRGRLCLSSATTRTAPRPRFAISCSAAARRGPLDLRTRSVPNPQGHQRLMNLSCAATQGHEAPLLCAVRKAGRAAPVVRSQSVAIRACAWRVAMVWCSRDVWPASCTDAHGMWHRRGAGSCVRRGGEACDRAVEAYGDASCTDACGVWHRRGAGSCVGRGGGVRSCGRDVWRCVMHRNAWPVAPSWRG